MAYTIKKNTKFGRYAVASKNLKAGEEVLTEETFVVGPKPGSPPLCLGCHCPVDCSVVCTVCKWPVCGEECEQILVHRQAECEVFVAAKVQFTTEQKSQLDNGSPQYECITPLRMLLKKEHDPARWEESINALEAHTEERRSKSVWTTEHINVVEFLRKKCKLAERFSEEFIHWVIGVLEVNAFELRTEDGYFVRGLYPQTAMMAHSCVANTTHMVYPKNNFRSHVRTTVDVPKGGELYVSYTSSIQPTLFRRENLKSNKYFDCDCKRCADPTELQTHLSSLLCTKCNNGVITSSKPLDQCAMWKCSSCEFHIKPDTVRRIFGMIQKEIDQLEYIEDLNTRIEETEKLMAKFKNALHPHNVYITSLRHILVQLYGRAPQYTFEHLPDILLQRKIDLSRQILEVVDVIKPGLNRFRGMILYELHVPMMLLNRNKFRKKDFKKEELKKRMKEVATILEEAVRILCLEDPTSLEGAIGQAGKESLNQLKISINKI